MMARLALSLAYFPAHRERRRALADRALAMARRIGEPAALAEALAANHEATWGPDNGEERLAMTRELAGRAAELGDGALAATAHVRSAAALLELADFDASRGELRQLTRLAEALRQSYPRWFVAVARATRAFLEGRLEKCEALAHVAATVGRGWNEDTAMGLRALQLSYVRSEQGRHEEAVEWAERMAEHFPELPAARASLALVYAQAERHAAAREELELLAGGDFADLPRDAMWLPGIHALCQIARCSVTFAARSASTRCCSRTPSDASSSPRCTASARPHGRSASSRRRCRASTTPPGTSLRDRARHQRQDPVSPVDRPHPARLRPGAASAQRAG
jgi:tetratricopeptide (TPR) repeat protein